MDTIDELAQLADSMRQASALLADKDVNENSSSSRRPSTFLNVVALVNTGIICLTSCSSTTPIAIVVALLALPVATATSSLSGNRRIFSSRRFDWFLMTFGSILANQNQDILLVLAVQAQECLSLLNQFQLLMVEIST
ncbi:uncharacterized protein LOC114261454 isoform X4 [Camellia sinensis]|uniref:uncharacterized protein LOC114261454 isoform X4 n=1 Tax=Camellia sinensis TaxID=4442 RepID=UPI0010361A86|nr:uncharacterized protein LOC114261454 isoform X4 [Camellia sinensis]XP_028057531.1 uncharacterized protein LOC114261454 isoform X4 [Camellia sinensis]